jgi:hypothetical protein
MAIRGLDNRRAQRADLASRSVFKMRDVSRHKSMDVGLLSRGHAGGGLL